MRSLSRINRTAPCLVWKRTQTTPPARSRAGSLLRARVRWFVFTAAEKVRTERHGSHSLVSENVSILVGVEGQLKDAVHDAALDGHLGVLQLLFARVLPNGITGHGAVQVAQEVLHRRRLVVRGCAALERWRGGGGGRGRRSRCDGVEAESGDVCVYVCVWRKPSVARWRCKINIQQPKYRISL